MEAQRFEETLITGGMHVDMLTPVKGQGPQSM